MVLAARGLRHLDGGEEKVEDEEAALQIRRRSYKVHIESILAAIALTILSLMIS